MKIGKKLYVVSRKEWRDWLRKNHKTASDIWLVYHKKESGMPRIPYNDAVEEALCFGWIDSIMKRIDGKKYAQRFSPRKPASQLSEMNRERIRRLIRRRKMTPAGLAAVHVALAKGNELTDTIPPDILKALRKNKTVWENFRTFPASYRRIRIGWIVGARRRPEIFRQRLRYILRMTGKNKKFGMVR
jgi:uncharacterized protein YdeI (YjbR/CyaY-like superfamily)